MQVNYQTLKMWPIIERERTRERERERKNERRERERERERERVTILFWIVEFVCGSRQEVVGGWGSRGNETGWPSVVLGAGAWGVDGDLAPELGEQFPHRVVGGQIHRILLLRRHFLLLLQVRKCFETHLEKHLVKIISSKFQWRNFYFVHFSWNPTFSG